MGMRYKQFYTYLTESNAEEAFSELYHEQIINILDEFVSGRKHVSWRTITAGRLIKVWNDFGKTGIVRDEKGMLMFKKILLNNIVRLTITTELSGHSQHDPQDIIDDAGFGDEIDLEDSDVEERFFDFLTDEETGGWFVSDYGLKPLQQLWTPIYNEKSTDKLIYLIDKALNVIHQRSDLAAMFVEGGTSTLLKAGGYHHEN